MKQWNALVFHIASNFSDVKSSFITGSSSLNNPVILKDMQVIPFVPFTIYLRTMETNGYQKQIKGNSKTDTFDVSRLSEGIKCAMQGCKLKIFFFSIILIK